MLRWDAREFVEQAKELSVRGASEQILRLRPEKWIEFVKAILLSIFCLPDMHLPVEPVRDILRILTEQSGMVRIRL